jgi:hypothetical protein
LGQQKTSGFRGEAYTDLHEVFKKNLKYFDMIYQKDGVIFSHAGVSSTWCRDNRIDPRHPMDINSLWREGNLEPFFLHGTNSSGDSITESPVWIRPESLLKDKIPKFIQVVGHTYQEKITNTSGVFFTDVLDTTVDYIYIVVPYSDEEL